MKKLALPLAIASIVALTACNEQSDNAAAPAGAETQAALETSEQRLSYGIALGLGSRMRQDGMPVDADAFIAGFKDGLYAAEPRLTTEEIQQEMQVYQEKVTAEAQAAAEALASENAAAGEAFLAENGKREGVVVTETGLQYEILEAGDGALPGADDTVEVHYRGTLIDGTEFDSSYGRGQTVTFGVGQVIPGWTEALQLMPAGSKWKLAIPSDLAYGAGGAGQLIGPNATLLFDVELISIPSQQAAAEGDAEAPAEG